MDVREQVRRAAQQAEDAASLAWGALRELREGAAAPGSKAFGRERARRIAVERQLEEMRRARDEERAMRERANRELDEARAEKAAQGQECFHVPPLMHASTVAELDNSRRIISEQADSIRSLRGKLLDALGQRDFAEQRVKELEGKLAQHPDAEAVERLQRRVAELSEKLDAAKAVLKQSDDACGGLKLRNARLVEEINRLGRAAALSACDSYIRLQGHESTDEELIRELVKRWMRAKPAVTRSVWQPVVLEDGRRATLELRLADHSRSTSDPVSMSVRVSCDPSSLPLDDLVRELARRWMGCLPNIYGRHEVTLEDGRRVQIEMRYS